MFLMSAATPGLRRLTGGFQRVVFAIVVIWIVRSAARQCGAAR
jgi:hypothetical protein